MNSVKSDIRNRADLVLLLEQFYAKASVNTEIGDFFTITVRVNWEEHIPKIATFWESLLFGNVQYKGNVMEKHLHLDKMKKMEHLHFETWFRLWEETARALFQGEKTDELISRGRSIATIMDYKMNPKQ